MQFLRRNQYLLCFAAVLVFSSVMVLRQFTANQEAHVEMREDFIALCERGETAASERLYQRLIQQLPDSNDARLVEDLQRTAMLVSPEARVAEGLLWKYHVSVQNELQRRIDQRLARTLRSSESH